MMPPPSRPLRARVTPGSAARWSELVFYGFALTALTVTPFLTITGGFDRVWNWLNDISLPMTMLGLGLLLGRTDVRLLRARARRLWPFAALVVLGGLSVLWSVSPNRTVYETMRLGVATALAFVMAARTSVAERVAAVGVTLSSGVVVSHLLGWKYPEVGVYAANRRWQGWYGHPTFLGSVVVLLAPCVFVAVLRPGWWRRAALAIAYVGVVIMNRAEAKTAIVVCVALLAVAGARLVWAMTRPLAAAARRAWLGAALAALAVVATVAFTSNAALWDRVREDRTLSERTTLWRALRPFIEQEWWRGFGLAGFFSDDGGYATAARRAANSSALVHAHSGYLQTWLDFGIAGLALMLVALGMGVRRSAAHLWRWRADRTSLLDTWPFLTVVAVALLNLTEPKFAGPEHLHWIVLILAIDAVSRPRAAAPVGTP